LPLGLTDFLAFIRLGLLESLVVDQSRLEQLVLKRISHG
jgi:hypothetical protein